LAHDKEQLERCLQRVKERPDSPQAHFNLGLVYTQQGRVERAEQAYRKALELDSELVEAWVNLGGVLMLKWDFRGSMEANREALKRRDDLLLAHYNLGQAHLYLGEAEGVVQANRRVVELDPDHAQGHYFLAVGLLATNKVLEARRQLARARELGHSPPPEFLRALEQAAEEAQRGERSVRIVEPIGDETPKDTKEN
jgi:tetratricopeptide (TPR) repeat protein